MINLSYTVAGQLIEPASAPQYLVADTVGVYQVAFTFDADWADMGEKMVVFRNPQVIDPDYRDVPVEFPLDANGQALVPAALLDPGKLFIGVYGTNSTQQFPTIWAPPLQVVPGASPGVEPSDDPALGTVIRTIPQTLTEEEKAQARENIGANEIEGGTPGNVVIIDNNGNIADGGHPLTNLPSNAELLDIRVGADGTTYTSASAAVRGQVTALKEDLKNYNAVNVLAYGEQVTKTHNNVTFTWTDKAHCNVKCTASSHSVGLCNLFYSVSSLPRIFEKGRRYYLKYTTTQTSGQRCLCDIYIFRNGNTNASTPDVVINVNYDTEFTIPADATGFCIRLRLLANYTVDENISIALLSAKTNVELEKEVISVASNFGLPNYTFGSGTHNGITYTWNSDNNRCHVIGTASANSFRNVYYNTSELPLGVNAGDKIGVLFNTTNEHIACRITYQLSSGYAYSPYFTEPTILTIPDNAVGMFLRLNVLNGYAVDGYATVPLIFKAEMQSEKIPFKAKKPLMVSLIDDDTSTDDLVAKFYQNCKHNGVVGSFAVCTKQYVDGTSDIDELLSYEYDGFNLIPHCYEQKTYLQPTNPDYDVVQARGNYFHCLRDFVTLGIRNPQNLWIIPYGSQDNETANLAKDLGFDMAFTTYGATNNYLTWNNKFGMHRCGLSPLNEVTDDTSPSATGSMAKCKARIDELVASETGGWAIFTTHFNTWQSETWDSTLDSNGYANGYSRFNELVQYAKDAGCEIVSMAQGAAYMKPIIDRNFTMG